MFEIDFFILQAEVLIPDDAEDDRMALGAIPALRLPSGNAKMLSRDEDEPIWLISERTEGVDLEDPLIRAVLSRIKEKHPDWPIKTSYCHDEITLPSNHGCTTQNNSLSGYAGPAGEATAPPSSSRNHGFERIMELGN